MKYCPKCGTGNEDDAKFCANCGQPLEANEQPAPPVVDTPAAEAAKPQAVIPEVQPPVQEDYSPSQEPAMPAQEVDPVAPQETPAQEEPEQEGYGGPVYTAPQPEPMESMVEDTGEKNPATLWLILNIVATVLCCCTNLPAIVGIVFAAIGMSSFKKGDVEDAKSKAKLSMILLIVGVALAIVSTIIAVAAGAIPAILSAMDI